MQDKINYNQISLEPVIIKHENENENKKRSKMVGDYSNLMRYFIIDFNDYKKNYKEDDPVMD